MTDGPGSCQSVISGRPTSGQSPRAGTTKPFWMMFLTLPNDFVFHLVAPLAALCMHREVLQ